MDLDPNGLRAASALFSKLLAAEAGAQRAYARQFPDGRISLELEWVDMGPMIQAMIAAYVSEVKK